MVLTFVFDKDCLAPVSRPYPIRRLAMKHLLTLIVSYKLNPNNFDHFIETLHSEVKKLYDTQQLYYYDEINCWLNELRAFKQKDVFSDTDHEIIDALLYRIEELLVYEQMFKPSTQPNL
jgi:hypothetical protein